MSDLSEREWMVLDVLWEAPGAELGVLVEMLRPKTGWNINTVHTYLTRMEKKGLVCINKNVSPHIYQAAVDKKKLSGDGKKKLFKQGIPWVCR